MTTHVPSQRFRNALRMTGATRLAKPRQLGSFYCHASIAVGGQGEVFLATGDLGARGRVCVLKTFLEPDEDKLHRAARSIDAELRLIEASNRVAGQRSLDHGTPMFADIIAWDLAAEAPWVAHDYRGPNLRMHPTERDGSAQAIERSRMKRQDRPSASTLVDLLIHAVDFIHRFDVVHRDLKPENVLVDGSGKMPQIVLIDFDLARGADQTRLTATFARGGTPGYTAPEQYFDFGSASPASDVYAVALLTVFLLTGLEPHEVLIGNDPRTRQLDPAVGVLLGERREWVERALSFWPEERPQLEVGTSWHAAKVRATGQITSRP